MGKFKSLEDVILNYAYVLIDACAFQGILGDLDLRFIKERLKSYQIQKESFEFWRKSIKYYRNCYTISEVVEELKNTDHDEYEENVGKYLLGEEPHKILEVQRAIREANEERNLLIKSLEKEQRIFQFDREEQDSYEESYEKHFRFEEIYDLHGADYPLAISGKTMVEFRGPSAIISNDFGIVRVWNKISTEENLSTKDFGFFVRKGANSFRRLRRGGNLK